MILAAPAHFDRDRLALLLGVAAQCQFRPVGLIDAAVAAAAGIGDAPNYLYVDVGLQQTVISYLTTEDGQLQHARFEVLADMGWVALRAELTHVLSAAFVQAARFDPLRHADTERQLQAQLTDLLRRINDQPNAVELALNCEHGDRQYPISVTAGTLVAPLRQRQLLLAGALQRLAPRGTPMLLAPMAALVPGLGDLLATLAPITALSDTAVARGALEFQSQIVHDGTALPFVRRLTLRSPPAQNEPHLTSLRSHAPAFQQFALHRNKLYVLNASPLPLTQGGAAAERAIRLADGPPRLLGQLASNGATAVLLRGDGAGITVNGADAAAVVALATGDVIAAANIPSASLGSATITIVELAAPQARS